MGDWGKKAETPAACKMLTLLCSARVSHSALLWTEAVLERVWPSVQRSSVSAGRQLHGRVCL